MFNTDSQRDTSDSANSRLSQTVWRKRLRQAYFKSWRSVLKSLMCKCVISIEAETLTETPPSTSITNPYASSYSEFPHLFFSLLSVLFSWILVLQYR